MILLDLVLALNSSLKQITGEDTAMKGQTSPENMF